ncbi:hypothetical protein ACSBR2_037916 [Camellia fascicularis]
MEGREVISSSGVTVVGSDAPSDYHVAPRTENPSQVTGSAPAAAVGVTAAGLPLTVKKKRGRPRKYGPDGTVTMALSPKPISSSAPSPVIDFSSEKRGKVRPAGSASKQQQHKMEMENLGEWVSCSVGANFTPHIITVNAGEGRFEILSLSGSFMPAETGGIRNRSGGMSVSLASPDGRVMGGGVAGLLVAASPVQIVVGSFLAGNQHEQKPKKQKTESITTTATPTAAIPISSTQMEESYGWQGPHTSTTPKPNLLAPSFHGNNWPSLPPDSRNKPTDINVTLAG